MENLGRGVVAVCSNETPVLVGWHLLGLKSEDIGFNVYRATGYGDPEPLNDDVLTGAINFQDVDADSTQSKTYHVRRIFNGDEGRESGTFMLPGDHAEEPVVRIAIKAGGAIKTVLVGELNGDGCKKVSDCCQFKLYLTLIDGLRLCA